MASNIDTVANNYYNSGYSTGYAAGKKLYDLGTGTSFNVTGYSGYTGFTTSNFIAFCVNGSGQNSGTYSYYAHQSDRGRADSTATISNVFSYNSATGILSAYSILYIAIAGASHDSVTVNEFSWSIAMNSTVLSNHAYLII
jgi:hypothetical protein